MAMLEADGRTELQRSPHALAPERSDLRKAAISIFPGQAPHLDARPEWQLALRIAASRSFAKSDLLPRFLLYVCERELSGRTHEITETQIGVHVFQRSKSYNPAEDNIVRSYARNLRKRLEEYFRTDGSSECLRVSIPLGGYVPVFERVEPAELRLEAPTETGCASGSPIATKHSPAWVKMTVAAALGMLAGILLMQWRQASSDKRAETVPPRPTSTAHAVWKQMFQSSRDTILVPADSGLGILENLTHRPLDLATYESSAYADDRQANGTGFDPHSLADLKTQQYTSVVDLNILIALEHLPEFDASRTRIRAPRSVSPSDLKQANVVLVGSVHTNPWVALFDGQLSFHLVYRPEVDDSYIENDQPRANEQAVYRNEAGTRSHRTYAVVDYLPNLDGTGHVLIIQGLTMAGTQAAADILLYSPSLPKALKDAYLSDGSLRPFEILVETSTVGSDAPDAHILATRFHGA